jgi:hypothetical protein
MFNTTSITSKRKSKGIGLPALARIAEIKVYIFLSYALVLSLAI